MMVNKKMYNIMFQPLSSACSYNTKLMMYLEVLKDAKKDYFEANELLMIKDRIMIKHRIEWKKERKKKQSYNSYKLGISTI